MIAALVQQVVGIFQASAPAPRLSDHEAIGSLYRHWRIRVMYGTLIGYALFYFCRKNISIALPVLSKELGYTNTQLGALSTVLYVTYGIGKLVNGALGDHANPRWFMATGLMLSAVMNLLFGFSSALWALVLFWGINGWVQSMGFPPCARLLAQWYSVSERGLMWGIWNTSHQIGGAVIVVLAGYLIDSYGWRSGFIVPAIICLFGGVMLAERLRDTPVSMGLPPVAQYRQDPEVTPNGELVSDKPETLRQIVFDRVLRNRTLLLVSLVNLFVYVVRSGVFDWGAKFLVERHKNSLVAAGSMTATFELAGIGGALLAGAISDRLSRRRRGPVCVVFLLLTALATALLYFIPAGHPHLHGLSFALLGFLIYGPQFLVGVFVTDIASSKAAATAIGVTGIFGYAGAALSGVGTGYFVDRYGWAGGFSFWIGAAVIGALVGLPLWRVGVGSIPLTAPSESSS
ncbi:MAG TPA: MFS transporter [Polyangium sp.]|nr:MFS transporter [Polyangium sp.]